MMFGSKVGFSGSADPMVQLSIFKNSRWRLTAIRPSWTHKNGHNFATGLPMDMMIGSRLGFLAELRFLP